MSSMGAYDLTEDDKEKIRDSGRELVIVPDAVFDHVKDDEDENGNPIGTFDVVRQEYNDNFEYEWIDEQSLSVKQKQNWLLRTKLLEYFELTKWEDRIRLSKTINEYTSGDVRGVYDPLLNLIIIKPAVLESPELFYETLTHELIHATTGYLDNTRDFENMLGKYVGRLAVSALRQESVTEENNSMSIASNTSSKSTGFFGRLFQK